MAQIPYPTGIKPLVKPKAIAPSFPPLDAGLSMGQRQPTKAAPVVQPVVNMVRPTGPTPANNYTQQTLPAPKPVVAPAYNPQTLTGKSAYNAQMARDQNRVDEAPNSGVTTQNKYNARNETPAMVAARKAGLGYIADSFYPSDTAKFASKQQILQSVADAAGDAVAIGAPALIAGTATAPIGGVGALPAALTAGAVNYGMKAVNFGAEYFGSPSINYLNVVPGAVMGTINLMGAVAALKKGNLPKALQLAGPVAFQIFSERGAQGLSDYIYKETGIKTKDIISNLGGVYSANIFQKYGNQNIIDAERDFRLGAGWANQKIQDANWGPWLKQKAQDAIDFNSTRKEWTDRDILKSENAASTGGWFDTLKNYKTYINSALGTAAHAQPEKSSAGRFRGYTTDSIGKMSISDMNARLFGGFYDYFGIGVHEFDHLTFPHLREGYQGAVPRDYKDAFKWDGIPTPTTLAQKVVDKFYRLVGGPNYNDKRYKAETYYSDPTEISSRINSIISEVQPVNPNKFTELEWAAAQKTEPFQTMVRVLGLKDSTALRSMLENHENPDYFGRTSYYPRGKDGIYGSIK